MKKTSIKSSKVIPKETVKKEDLQNISGGRLNQIFDKPVVTEIPPDVNPGKRK
ncbi:MAG TPA: hypothetical protein PK657_04680 [Legionella sp.]|nr:hypothetical protein [Legionella sp.]